MLGANCGEDFKTISINEYVEMQAIIASKETKPLKRGKYDGLK